MAETTIYCPTCGAEGDPANTYCTSCGASYQPTPRRVAGHIGFVLNELAAEPMRSAIQPAIMRETLVQHYRGELARLIGPRPAPQAPAMAAPFAPAPAPSRPLMAPPPARRAAPAAMPAPLPAREPYDWSWLATQQANLFLFAGAFLTVIAALIYVGYSGQAVGGGLKMSLLAGYTLAFLAAGIACRRVERVAMAGTVFFAVGAILVPLNFIAARSIFSDEEISAESMWLAGSMVSALFYAAVAWLGLGRAYTVAAGAAILSATLAALHVAAAPVAWWPLAIIAAGFAMTLTQISAPQDVRRRLGDIWSPMGQLAAGCAAVIAIGIAVLTSDDSLVDLETTRWFLALTLAAFTIAALYVARGTLWVHASLAALAGFVAAWVSVAYAMQWPAEGYAITIALLAVALIAGDAFARRGQLGGIAPVQTGGVLYAASLTAATVALIIVTSVLLQANEEITPYIITSRWFVLAVAAPLLAVAAIDAFVLRTRLGAVTLPVAAAGVASSALYGWQVSPEWHAAVIATAAAVVSGAARFATDDMAARVHGSAREDAFIVARIGAASAALFAVLFGMAASGDAPDVVLSTRWYLPVTLTLVALAAAFDTRARVGVAALPVAFAGAVSAALWALDVPLEWHSVAIAAAAAGFAAAARFGDRRFDAWTNEFWRADTLFVARAGAIVAAGFAIVVAAASTGDTPDVVLSTRWYLAIALVLVALTAAIDSRTRLGVTALHVMTAGAVSAGLWALDVSLEWHPLAIATVAAIFAAGARFADARVDAWANAAWRADTMIVARVGALAAALIALLVAGDASDATPIAVDTRWFLAMTFAMATTVALIDASRKAMGETTAALGVGIIATVLACVWRFDAPAAAYGVALSATGIALAAAGRVARLPWIDGFARDGVAASAVGGATVPFWPAYVQDNGARYGAATHLAAAVTFALAAISDGSERALTLAEGRRVRVNIAWLYVATFSAIAGYVFVLRSMPASEGADSGSLTMPLLAAAIAVTAVGASAKRWRPEFSVHLYAMGLLTGAVSLSMSPDMQTLAIALSVLTIASAAVAIFENRPLYGAPAAATGAAAILSWHVAADATPYALPLLYAAAALALYAIGFALQTRGSRMFHWSDALRGTGGAFALIAPVAAYALMSDAVDNGAIDGVRWYESALYQATIATVGVIGVLALAEASIAGRRWIIVPASAVLVTALLMQIGTLNPQNIQAYTVVIGFYLVLLGAFGLGRFRLIPELTPLATSFEALGAATIVTPMFIQSFADGWHYDALLVTESAAFLAAGIALRRRGVLSVALFFLVAAGARALFDAISAMPNWIVAMIAGVTLLGIGLGILAGRERWDRWQEAVIRWWGETGNGHATS